MNPEIDILEQIIEATGLPQRPLRAEMDRLLKQAEIEPNEVTMAAIRKLIANYLLDILPQAKELYK